MTEQLNEQADQIFQTRAHDDIFRRDRNAAEIMQIVRNLLPQLKHAARIGRLEQARGIFAQHAPREMRPGRERKAAVIYDIRLEIVIIPLVSRIFSHGSVHSFRMNGRRRRDLLLHEIAASRRGNDVALCGKLTVGGLDRDLADAQVRRELTLARQARAAGERSRHDVRPYRAVKLLVKRHAALRVQMICQHAFPPLFLPGEHKNPFSPALLFP